MTITPTLIIGGLVPKNTRVGTSKDGEPWAIFTLITSEQRWNHNIRQFEDVENSQIFHTMKAFGAPAQAFIDNGYGTQHVTGSKRLAVYGELKAEKPYTHSSGITINGTYFRVLNIFTPLKSNSNNKTTTNTPVVDNNKNSNSSPENKASVQKEEHTIDTPPNATDDFSGDPPF